MSSSRVLLPLTLTSKLFIVNVPLQFFLFFRVGIIYLIVYDVYFLCIPKCNLNYKKHMSKCKSSCKKTYEVQVNDTYEKYIRIICTIHIENHLGQIMHIGHLWYRTNDVLGHLVLIIRTFGVNI